MAKNNFDDIERKAYEDFDIAKELDISEELKAFDFNDSSIIEENINEEIPFEEYQNEIVKEEEYINSQEISDAIYDNGVVNESIIEDNIIIEEPEIIESEIIEPEVDIPQEHSNNQKFKDILNAGQENIEKARDAFNNVRAAINPEREARRQENIKQREIEREQKQKEKEAEKQKKQEEKEKIAAEKEIKRQERNEAFQENRRKFNETMTKDIHIDTDKIKDVMTKDRKIDFGRLFRRISEFFKERKEARMQKKEDKKIEKIQKKEMKKQEKLQKKENKKERQAERRANFINFMTKDRSTKELGTSIVDSILFVPRLLMLGLAKLVLGKNEFEKQVKMNELMMNKKEHGKEAVELKKNKDKSFDKAIENVKGLLKKKSAIEHCKNSFEGKTLEEIFNNEKDLKIFVKYYDAYLDETFLKGDKKEFDLEIKDGEILISKMNREDKTEKELMFGANINEIYKSYQDKEPINKDMYTAMLELCNKSGIKYEPTLNETRNILEERVSAFSKSDFSMSEEIMVRGVVFNIERNEQNKLTISSPIELNNINNDLFVGGKKVILENIQLEDIDFDKLTLDANHHIGGSIQNTLNSFEEKQKIETYKEEHENKSIKNSLEIISNRNNLEDPQILFDKNAIMFTIPGKEMQEPTAIVFDFNGDIIDIKGKDAAQINKDISMEEISEISKEIRVINDKIQDYNFIDVIENQHDKTGEFVQDGEKYNYEQIEYSNIYNIYKDDEYQYSYKVDPESKDEFGRITGEKIVNESYSNRQNPEKEKEEPKKEQLNRDDSER